jgi:hypothetical protein
MTKKVILKELPRFSHRKEGKLGDLVAIVTATTDRHVHTPCDPSEPIEIYIGRLESIYIMSQDKHIDNALKLRLTKNENYKITLVDTIVSQNPAWLLEQKGILYLKKNLPKDYKEALKL